MSNSAAESEYRASHSGLNLRPIQPEDETFLRYLYGETRQDLACLDLEPAQRETLIALQFQIQQLQYTQLSATTELSLVLLQNQPIGKLYIDPGLIEIRVLEIAILPRYQNQGIGTILLTDILARGTQMNLPVTLHVAPENPALCLYTRLGFNPVREDESRIFMEWIPSK